MSLDDAVRNELIELGSDRDTLAQLIIGIGETEAELETPTLYTFEALEAVYFMYPPKSDIAADALRARKEMIQTTIGFDYLSEERKDWDLPLDKDWTD